MTLKQLLDSLSFDEIAPFIDLEGGKNTLAPFKQHFDYLRHLTPEEGESGEVSVGYWEDPDLEDSDLEDQNSDDSDSEAPDSEDPDLEDGEGEDGDGKQLFAGALEGDCWESCLAKEIVLDEGVTASPAEIAGCCLWHTSYYGFLPEEVGETVRNWHKGKDTTQYYIRKFKDILPTRGQMQSVPSFHQAVRRKIRFHRKHRSNTEIREFGDLFGGNFRKWRYWKRHVINAEYARRIDINAEFIENVLERGTGITNPPAREEFGRLFRANHVSIHRCDTLAYYVAGRLDYLRELVGKYGLLKENGCLPDSFVCISASPEHPLTADETAEIGALVTSGHCGVHRIWTKSDAARGEDLRVDIAYYG